MASKHMYRTTLMAAALLILQGCGGFIPFGNGPDDRAPSRGPSTGAGAGSESGGIGTPSGSSARGPSSAPACTAQLSSTGARFSALPDSYGAPGCNQLGAVRLDRLAGDGSPFEVSGLGPVKCDVAKAFSGWARFGVDRAARQVLGSRLVRIETMGSYSCRNVAGTNRRSAHARAEAIDVSGFVLADGRRIVLKQDWDGGTSAEREFLRIVHRSACKRFGTVLGPEYNRAHADHFHFEGTGAKFCR